MSKPENLHDLLAAALQAHIDNGQAQLPIDESSRNILRRWAVNKQRGNTAAAPRSSRPSALESEVMTHEQQVPVQGVTSSAEQLQAAASANPQPERTPIQARPAKNSAAAGNHATAAERSLAALPEPQLDAHAGKQEQLGKLWQHLAAWRAGLSEPAAYGKVALWGRGDVQAGVMFVGEYPTVSDELNSVYISERAGAKFDAILRAMGLEREQIWLSSLLKYTPLQADSSSSLGRSVELQEFAAFRHLLQLEVEIIKPQVIVALGDSVFSVLCGQGLQADNAVRVAEFAGCKVVGSYTPSHIVMYDHDIAEKRKFWLHMLEVMRLAGMPVSPRQANYFVQK